MGNLSVQQSITVNKKPPLGDTLVCSIPMVFVCMMLLALLVMGYASVKLVGKALVSSEESRVAQVALSVALEVEKRKVYIEQLTESLAIIGQSGLSSAEIRRRVEERLDAERADGLVISGGIWPEPYTLKPDKERASLFWHKTDSGFVLIDDYNRADEPLYSKSVWYLASKQVSDGCFWTAAYTDPWTKQSMITCSRAMYIEDKFIGVASLDVSTKFIDSYIDKHMVKIKGYATLLDRNLRVIAKPSRSAFLRQNGFDMGEQDDFFPAYLESVNGHSTFASIEQLIAQSKASGSNPPLDAELTAAFDQTEAFDNVEERTTVRAYLNRDSTTERKPLIKAIEQDPVFGEAAKVFLVHMPRIDANLVIVVPEIHILNQSKSTLSGLFLIMLVSTLLSVAVLWLWLRQILILPLKRIVKHLRLDVDDALDTDQKFEIRALAKAYNNKQSELKASVDKLDAARKRYHSILHNATEAIAVVTDCGKLLEGNETLMELFEDSWTSVRGSSFESHLIETDRKVFSRWLNSLLENHVDHERIEISILGEKQHVVLMEISASVSHQECDTIVTLFMRDVGVRREAERAIAKMAVTDCLTGLYNRAGFSEKLELSLASAQAKNEKVALLFIDLDYFKEVNDIQGHDAGDQLLKMVAERLICRRRESDVVARLGGDEFAIILTFSSDKDMISRIAEQVVNALNRPFEMQGYEDCRIGASVGISIYPDDADSVAELVRQADIAMYQSKNDGRNGWSYYAKEQDEAHRQRQQLIQELELGIIEEQFILDYQPIVDAKGKLVFLEALIRWQHPQHGLISPMDFIPLAERTGLIVEIGAWVVERACRSIREWRDNGTPVSVVSINVSAMQIQRGGFMQTLEQAMQRYQLEPSCLLLEMTESLLLDASYAQELQNIRQRGFGIAIDDFGTGYSSLSYLQNHKVDYLKIDKAFVAMLLENSNASLSNTIIKLSRVLGTKVIAEGIEQESQFKQLAEMQSDYMQGFWIAKPIAQNKVSDWIEAFNFAF